MITQPTGPGFYMAREIVYGLANTRLPYLKHRVEVVADISNPRGHKLLVKTGGTCPRYKALDCYEWAAQ